jgi:tetratricopeptide (TPR) repeat protein
MLLRWGAGMPWEWFDFGNLPKILAVIATLVTIGSGALTIAWRIRSWNKRRLNLLKEYLEEREDRVSERRTAFLRKVADTKYNVPEPGEPDVSREVDEAIKLLDRNNIRAAQLRLEALQERILEKQEFIERYSEDLKRHHANVSLFLAAIADRRNDPEAGLHHISEARSVLSSDVDVLKYEGLLQLKAKNWSGAQATFQKLEDAAKGPEVRHYKAEGADGRGDALRGLGQVDDAISAYGTALSRMTQAEARHRHPLFQGRVSLKIAELHARKGDQASLQLALRNVDDALQALKSSHQAEAREEIARAEALKRLIKARPEEGTTTSRPTN